MGVKRRRGDQVERVIKEFQKAVKKRPTDSQFINYKMIIAANIENVVHSLEPERAKQLLLKLHSLGAHRYTFFWWVLRSFISKFPSLSKDLYGVFREGFERQDDIKRYEKDAFSVAYWQALAKFASVYPDEEHIKGLIEDMYRKRAYRESGFWEVIGEYIRRSSNALYNVYPLLREGLKNAEIRSNWKYWYTVGTFLKLHPTASKNLLRDIYSLGAHREPAFWSIDLPVEQYELRDLMYKILKEAETDVYKTNGFWRNLEQFISAHPDLSKELYIHFKKGFEGPARKHTQFWAAFNSLSYEYPHIFKDLVDYILSRGGYEHVPSLSTYTLIPHPFLEVYRKIRKEGFVSKETKELLRKWRHPHARYLSALAKARAWYLKDILMDPGERCYHFVKTAEILESKGFKVGWRTAKKIYEELPFVMLLPHDELESIVPENIGEFFTKIRDKLRKRYTEDPLTAKFFNERDMKYLNHVLAYKGYEEHLKNLPKDSEELFNYKFFYVPEEIKRRVLGVAKTLEQEKHFIVTADISGMLRALKEEAENEGLFEREDAYSKIIQSVYRKIVSDGLEAKLTEKEIQALRNTEKAKEVGIKETVSKIASILEKTRVSRGRIRIAMTVPQHLAYMNVPGSCMRARGMHSDGAIGVTGGPGIIIGIEDHHGKVLGRVVLSLWVKRTVLGKKYLFVPNHVYGIGGKELMERVRKILKSHGIDMHPEVKAPKGYRPAPSKHTIRAFWKDGHGKIQFGKP